jgi:hypothetical protein
MSLDVQISVSKLATLGRLNLSNICVVGEDLGFLPDANRLRMYSSLQAVGTDFATSTDVYLAASAFFSQSPRPAQMAIGEAFLTAQKGMIVGAQLTSTDLTALGLITTGSMVLTLGLTTYILSALNFSTCADVDDVAVIIQAKLTSGTVPATCTVKTLPGGEKRLMIATTATGEEATVLLPTTHSTGIFVGPLLNMSVETGGLALNGYTPTDIAGEIQNIQNAANSIGQFIYGWCLVQTLRDVDIQVVAAAWALAQTNAVMALVTNDPNALSPSYTTDLGSVLKPLLNRRVYPIYAESTTQYPDVSILAYMLSVNYLTQDATVTAKFKTLPGCTPVSVTETQWSVLQSKAYNIYSITGINAQVYREGTSADESTPWFMDTVINIDNFVQDLAVNVYNVFLRNAKIPYTSKGQMLLVDACRDTGNQYVYNGTFADRQIISTTNKSGVDNLPAVVITPTPISQISPAVRASRIGPPIHITVQEAGAIHSIAISVEVVS